MTIPHPDSSEFLVSIEMLFLLYFPKKILDLTIDREVKAVKKQIYRHHNRHHSRSLRHCTQDDCLQLMKSRSSTRSPADLSLLVSAEPLASD